MWGKEFRAFLYIAGLLWCFLGVSVLSDTFMAGIERITEGTHQVKRKRKNPDGTFALENGQPIFDTVDELIWNPAVANLSLMALGSSTPEILLGIIETIGGGFYAGALGPGTVVGSAAFNLYVITGICMVALEEGETRKVEGVTVFLITATSSLFAYIWLGIVLMVWTPNIVTLEEALITFLFMPLLLVIVWCADNDWFRTPPQQVHPENETEGGTTAGGEGAEGGAGGNGAAAPMKFAAAAAVRRVSMAGGLDDIGRVAKVSYLAHRRAIAAKSSGAAKRSLQEVMEKQRAASAIPGHAEQKHMSAMMKLAHQESFQIQTHTTFHFRSASSAFPKAHGKAQVSIVRGGKQGTSAKIRVQTRDGNVFAPAAFDKFDQVVTFEAHENEKVVEIPYKTDFAWKKDHFFEVLLIKTGEGEEVDERSCKTMVTVVSDNEGDEGNITWSTGVASFLSTDSAAILLMQLAQGLDHTTNVRVLTKSGTAKDGVDFMGLETNVEFRAYETAKTIKIPLVPRKKNDEVNKASEFSVCMWQLSEKGEKIGEEKVVTISIIHSQGEAPIAEEEEEEEEEETSWAGQFREAMNVNAGGDLSDATIMDCVMHWMSIGWKVMSATTPPASVAGGYACFWWALALIGFTTAIIGDLASIFGCLCGLKDEVTAITIVALGTSLPDTFASMLAIKADETADNAIGNVTGSNSVNVFLGLGIPWTLSAVYWSTFPTFESAPQMWKELYLKMEAGEWQPLLPSILIEKPAFIYEAKNLGFSLIIFCSCTLCAFLILFLRRKFLGAEFGGNSLTNKLSAAAFVTLWLVFVIVYSAQVYGAFN